MIEVAPSWASVVRDGARLRTSQSPTPTLDVVTRGDFVTLYERCIASRLKARVQESRRCPSPVRFHCPVPLMLSLLPDAVIIVAVVAAAAAAATGTLPKPSMALRRLRPLPTPIAIPFQRIWRHRLR
jgi:hypothetical protein